MRNFFNLLAKTYSTQFFPNKQHKILFDALCTGNVCIYNETKLLFFLPSATFTSSLVGCWRFSAWKFFIHNIRYFLELFSRFKPRGYATWFRRFVNISVHFIREELPDTEQFFIKCSYMNGVWQKSEKRGRVRLLVGESSF